MGNVSTSFDFWANKLITVLTLAILIWKLARMRRKSKGDS